MDDPTNNKRALFANSALSAFVNEVGDSGEEEINLQDLIADTMHLCDAQDWDFDDLVRRARSHYEEEVRIDPKADVHFAEGR